MEEGARPLSDIPAINRFLSYCRIRTVPSKTVVIHAGDLPDVLYYIVSGSVEEDLSNVRHVMSAETFLSRRLTPN